MKHYEGKRSNGRPLVMVDGSILDPHFDLRSHNPDGFEWGYGGTGPAQLALALLADCLQDNKKALALHQNFKWKVVAGLPYYGWKLTAEDIHRAIQCLPKA